MYFDNFIWDIDGKNGKGFPEKKTFYKGDISHSSKKAAKQSMLNCKIA